MARILTAGLALVPCCLAYVIHGRHEDRLHHYHRIVIVAFAIVSLSILALYNIILYPKLFSPLRNLPGPKSGSVWNGQSKKLFSEPNGWPATEWMLSIPNKGLIKYLGLFNRERVIITSSQGLAEVCNRTNDFPKPEYISQLAGAILGPGLVLVNGNEHRRQRKMLSPAFTSKNVKDLYPLFWKKSMQLTDLLGSEIDSFKKSKPPASPKAFTIEISEYASRTALDVITLAALGKDWDSLKDPDTTLCKTYNSIFQLGKFATIMALLKAFIPEYVVQKIPLAKNNQVQNAAQIIKDTCRQSVQEKRRLLHKGSLETVDLLSVLIRGTEITDEEAVYQMMTFLAAGHETLATAVTWTVYMLCVHPEWQMRLRQEVRTVLSASLAEDQVTSQDIDNLTQLNAFCNETLRWWPPIPSTLRTTARDTTLTGHYIPKGTRLVIPIRGSNRNPELWGADAAVFNPQRWIKDDGKFDASGGTSSKYGMLTFMHGIRNCIGQSFAKGEMASIIATLIGRFQFSLSNPVELDERNVAVTSGGVTARPTNGMFVNIELVEGW